MSRLKIRYDLKEKDIIESLFHEGVIDSDEAQYLLSRKDFF